MIVRPTLVLAALLLLAACGEDTVVRSADGAVGDPVDEGRPSGNTPDETVAGGPSGGGTAGEGPVSGERPVIPDDEPGAEAPTPAVALPDGSRAGAYVGRFADGEGVFVLDRGERLLGLVERADGSATSWFADFGTGTASGPAARFAHAASEGAADEVASPLGETRAEGPELGLVDGERIVAIEGDDVALEASGRTTLAPVTSAALDGRWRASHVDCDSLGEHCATVVVDIAFDGGTLAGSSGVFTADGTDLFPVPMNGTLVPLGGFAEVVFEWNTYGYTGVLHFAPGGTERLVMIGHTDRVLADHAVVGVVLTRVDGDA